MKTGYKKAFEIDPENMRIYIFWKQANQRENEIKPFPSYLSQ